KREGEEREDDERRDEQQRRAAHARPHPEEIAARDLQNRRQREKDIAHEMPLWYELRNRSRKRRDKLRACPTPVTNHSLQSPRRRRRTADRDTAVSPRSSFPGRAASRSAERASAPQSRARRRAASARSRRPPASREIVEGRRSAPGCAAPHPRRPA